MGETIPLGAASVLELGPSLFLTSAVKSLRQRVIAEGVETRTQVDFLRRQGCGEEQCFFFSRPAVPERCAELFKSGISPKEAVVH